MITIVYILGALATFLVAYTGITYFAEISERDTSRQSADTVANSTPTASGVTADRRGAAGGDDWDDSFDQQLTSWRAFRNKHPDVFAELAKSLRPMFAAELDQQLDDLTSLRRQLRDLRTLKDPELIGNLVDELTERTRRWVADKHVLVEKLSHIMQTSEVYSRELDRLEFALLKHTAQLESTHINLTHIDVAANPVQACQRATKDVRNLSETAQTLRILTKGMSRALQHLSAPA